MKTCRKQWKSTLKGLAEIHAATMSRVFNATLEPYLCRQCQLWHIGNKQVKKRKGKSSNGGVKGRRKRRAARFILEVWENEGGSIR